MAAREIKTTLALDGEKLFKAGMDDAYRAMKVLGSEAKLNTAEFGKNAQSMEGLTSKSKTLSAMQEQQSKIVAALAKAVEESAAAYGESDKRTDAYRVKLNNAKASLSNIENQLEQTNTDIDNFGRETDKANKKTLDWHSALGKVGSALKTGLTASAKTAAVAVGAVAVAAGTAMVKLGKAVVEQFGELEQNLGGSEAVFGQYADAIKKHGEDAYKNLGVSQSEYLATANKMGALFQGSGIAQQESLDMTVQAMQRAADMASVMGIDTQVALDSIAGAAKGNFTMMDNLGVAMNATNIEAYALAQGLEFTFATATQAEKAEMAMKMFLENTQQYAGNFAKESTETITGSIGMLQASVSSFVAGLGSADTDMAALTNNMATSLQSVIANITPVLDNIVTSLPAVVDSLIKALGSMLPQLLTTVTTMFAGAVKALVDMFPTLIPVMSDAIGVVVKTLVDNLPMIITAVTTLLTGALQALKANVKQIAETVKVLIKSFVQFITSNLPLVIDVAIELIFAIIDGLVSAIPDLVAALPQIITAIVGGLISAVPKLMDVGVNLVKGLWEGIKSMGTWLWDKLTGWVGDVVGWLTGKDGFDEHSPSKVTYKIGRYVAQGLANGITQNAGLVTNAMGSLVPSAVNSNVTMDVTRRFTDVTNSRASGHGSLVVALREALGDQIIVLNDREFGRAVRRVAMA